MAFERRIDFTVHRKDKAELGVQIIISFLFLDRSSKAWQVFDCSLQLLELCVAGMGARL